MIIFSIYWFLFILFYDHLWRSIFIFWTKQFLLSRRIKRDESILDHRCCLRHPTIILDFRPRSGGRDWYDDAFFIRGSNHMQGLIRSRRTKTTREARDIERRRTNAFGGVCASKSICECYPMSAKIGEDWKCVRALWRQELNSSSKKKRRREQRKTPDGNERVKRYKERHADEKKMEALGGSRARWCMNHPSDRNHEEKGTSFPSAVMPRSRDEVINSSPYCALRPHLSSPRCTEYVNDETKIFELPDIARSQE